MVLGSQTHYNDNSINQVQRS